jgi:anti-sigma B factor antagonist
MSVTVNEGPDRVLVAVAGEIDTASSASLEAALLDAVRGGQHLDLDLSGVRFLDSSGLRALVVAQQAVVAQGGRVTLAQSTPLVDRLLEITGLDTLFLTSGSA